MADERAMANESAAPLIECFEGLPDPRDAHGRRHKLIDVVVIAVCATICGADGFIDMEEFGHSREDWLRTFLELPHGIPSHDTIGRVFAALEPTEFAMCLGHWVTSVATTLARQVVGIDGKKLRRSFDKANAQAALNIVSAWASEHRMTLGQVKVSADSNEITAVPELLRVLDLAGCIVTLDALHTQKEVVTRIAAKGADYVVALKDNHPTLKEEVATMLTNVREGRTAGYTVSRHHTLEKEHGRIETRRIWQVEVPPGRLPEQSEWAGLKSVAVVQAVREVGTKVSREERYYLSSLPADAEQIAQVIRDRWKIENSCHWVLDVVFREDDSRVRVGNAAENFAVVRRWALSLLQQERSTPRSIKTKRLKAALDLNYLLKVLQC